MVERERLRTLAFEEELSRRGRLNLHNRSYYLVALIWAFLAALPSLYVGRPIPFIIGFTAPYDIHSRVDFRWHDAVAETQALRNLESGYARRYREEPAQKWAEETHVPVGQFVTRAAAASTLSEVEQAAKELGIAASESQLEDLWRGALVAKNDPYHYLVAPLREILDHEIYAQGILEPDRFEKERGRTIQVVRGDSSHTVMVGGERGPVTAVQLGKLLERRFRTRLSAWIPDDFKLALLDVTLKRLRPNLQYDEIGSKAELEERRADLLARVQTVKRNDIMVSRGALLTLDRLAMIRAEENAFRETQGWRLPITRAAGNLLLFFAVALVIMYYFRTAGGNPSGAFRRFCAAAVLCLLPIWSGYLLIHFGLPGTMLPVGLAVGIAAFGMTRGNAVFVSAIASLCGLILFEGRPNLMVGYLAAGLFFIHTAARCRWRITLMIMSLFSGLIAGAAFLAWSFARGDLQDLLGSVSNLTQIVGDSLAPLLAAVGLMLNWLICGFLVLLLLPLVERFFGVTTRIRLQDLLAKEHPLLRRLIVEAPGTYHHSSIVSTLAEAGADAIGADGLRARIGGMFHDIGKLLKPEYFTENEDGVSRHEKMNPNMSALLIINHVRDGAEMARSFGLPSTVVDMILQHHGDSLMRYFHHEATRQAPPGAVVARQPFLYPGPKPQTPEAGVLMIADSVEAASRSLDRPSPQHLRELLSRLIRDRLIERQFEESGLTMRQLAQVEEVLFKMLSSMFHTRVKYPGQEKGKTGRKR